MLPSALAFASGAYWHRDRQRAVPVVPVARLLEEASLSAKDEVELPVANYSGVEEPPQAADAPEPHAGSVN